MPVFLPGESHGWWSLVGYSPWGHKESDTTERLSASTSTSTPYKPSGFKLLNDVFSPKQNQSFACSKFRLRDTRETEIQEILKFTCIQVGL